MIFQRNFRKICDLSSNSLFFEHISMKFAPNVMKSREIYYQAVIVRQFSFTPRQDLIFRKYLIVRKKRVILRSDFKLGQRLDFLCWAQAATSASRTRSAGPARAAASPSPSARSERRAADEVRGSSAKNDGLMTFLTNSSAKF